MKSCYECSKQVVCILWGQLRDDLLRTSFLAAPTTNDLGVISSVIAGLCLQYENGPAHKAST